MARDLCLGDLVAAGKTSRFDHIYLRKNKPHEVELTGLCLPEELLDRSYASAAL